MKTNARQEVLSSISQSYSKTVFESVINQAVGADTKKFLNGLYRLFNDLDVETSIVDAYINDKKGVITDSDIVCKTSVIDNVIRTHTRNGEVVPVIYSFKRYNFALDRVIFKAETNGYDDYMSLDRWRSLPTISSTELTLDEIYAELNIVGPKYAKREAELNALENQSSEQ